MKKRKLLYCFLGLSLSTVHATSVNPQAEHGARQHLYSIGIVTDEREPTYVHNDMVSGGVITISSSGRYQVSEQITYPLVIDADNCMINLNSFSITHNNANENIIIINAGHTNVMIDNGIVQNSAGAGTGSGIFIANSCSDIVIESVTIVDAGYGVLCDGTSGNEITSCLFRSIAALGSTVGFSASFLENSFFENCSAKNVSEHGFLLQDCLNNSLLQCSALLIEGTSTAGGIRSIDGTHNLFQQCSINGVTTSSTTFGDTVAGIVLSGEEQDSTILRCSVNQVEASNDGAWSLGLYVEPTILAAGAMLDLTRSYTAPLPASGDGKVSWSSDERYIATASSTVEVYRLENSGYLTSVASLSSLTDAFVSFSPDNAFLAVTDSVITGGAVYFYEFKDVELDAAFYSYSSGASTFGDAYWSPNGHFLVVPVVEPIFATELEFYRIEAAPEKDAAYLYSVTVAGDFSNYDYTVSLSWSPNGNYLACLPLNAGVTTEFAIYQFTTKGLVHVITEAVTGETEGRCIAWSPNGNYIALTGSDYVAVYSFDGSSVTFEDSVSLASGTANTVTWSPDGLYLARSSSVDIRVYSFDGSTLSLYDTYALVSPSIQWSPSGRYIAVGGESSTTQVQILDAMTAPSGIVMQDNTVLNSSSFGSYCGIGIGNPGGFDALQLKEGICLKNISSNNDVPYLKGVKKVFYGDQNRFDDSYNIAY